MSACAVILVIVIVIAAIAIVALWCCWMRSAVSAEPTTNLIVCTRYPNPTPSTNQAVISGTLGYGDRQDLEIEPELLDAKPTLYFFSSPKCGYCRSFQTTWEQLISRWPSVRAVKVDTSDPTNKDITLYYNVTLVPTIILVVDNRIQEYAGNRSMDHLNEFLASHL